MRLRYNASFNLAICTKVYNRMLLSFQNWSYQTWPEKRLFSCSICFQFVRKQLPCCDPFFDCQKGELFIDRIIFIRLLWENSFWILLGHLAKMTPALSIASHRTFKVVRARSNYISFISSLRADDPFSERVNVAESLRTSRFDYNNHTVVI
jgi:hypothetical protein